jgi:hypothetical protein
MGKVDTGRLRLIAALAASALGVLAAACNHAPHSNRSGIDLTVTVPADVKVKELSYAVIGNGIKPLVGQWHTAQPQQQFEKLITNIPPGADYVVQVVAKSIDGKKTCTHQTKASVRKDAITRVHVALTCMGGDGSIVISVGVGCTEVQLATFTASPLAASVGGTIALMATALEFDAGMLDYEWTATAGSFADPTAPQTTYRCETAGHIKLNLLVVSDICQENHDIEIDCLDPADAGARDARAN